MMQAIRQAHDAELRYPAHFVQLLRQGLQNAGLHIFKHRKRVVYVSLSRPSTFAPDGAVSENVAAILTTVAKFPLCTRKTLAEHVLARQIRRGEQAGGRRAGTNCCRRTFHGGSLNGDRIRRAHASYFDGRRPDGESEDGPGGGPAFSGPVRPSHRVP